VTKSTSPRAALKLAEAERFDVVLSDFKMPDMNGETFFRAMEAIAPHNAAHTGFITGDAMGVDVRRFLSTAKRPWIEKPIMRDELLDLISQAGAGKG
jgi:CheY-like chemotaxis protein